jgi:hypothetical protein
VDVRNRGVPRAAQAAADPQVRGRDAREDSGFRSCALARASPSKRTRAQGFRSAPPLKSLVAQRVQGLALGYEDLNDHDHLRADPLLALAVDHPDPQGRERRRGRDRGKALAGKSTLNRLELTPAAADARSRYKKIAYDRKAIERLFVELFLQAHATPPREVVLDLDATEDTYCARGEMENRIKEQQGFLFADRTSAATMRANQLRLWFSSLAYVLVQTRRRLGLPDTDLAQATCQTIRLKLLKIGAQIKVTVRRIWLSLAEGDPLKGLFATVCRRLQALPLRC